MAPTPSDLERHLLGASKRSRTHARRPSWEPAWFQNGGRYLPGGQPWALIAAFDDEGPAADIALATEHTRFEITGVRHRGTRGTAPGSVNVDRSGDTVLLSWLTGPDVAALLIDTAHGSVPATAGSDVPRLGVRLFLTVLEDPDLELRRARTFDDAGAELAVEDLTWITDPAGDASRPAGWGSAGWGSTGWGEDGVARTAAEIAEVLAEQDRLDAERGAVFRVHLADPLDDTTGEPPDPPDGQER